MIRYITQYHFDQSDSTSCACGVFAQDVSYQNHYVNGLLIFALQIRKNFFKKSRTINKCILFYDIAADDPEKSFCTSLHKARYKNKLLLTVISFDFKKKINANEEKRIICAKKMYEKYRGWINAYKRWQSLD